jgi:DNA repair exonuclease SbcCD ATPase subunit
MEVANLVRREVEKELSPVYNPDTRDDSGSSSPALAATGLAPPSAAVTARRVADMEAQFEQQLELVEHRAQMAIATARLEAAAEAEAAGQRQLHAQGDEFRAELAELEAQAERALTRSTSTEQEAERAKELDVLCGFQADTIERLQSEVAELTEARADEQRTHERVLAAKEAEWETMEHDFIDKIMAVESANRRQKKLEGALQEEQQRLEDAHAELETMQESLETLSRAASQQQEEEDEYDKGLLDDRLRAQLQARIVAVGKVHAQLFVDGTLWASAHFTAASMDTDSDLGDDQHQLTGATPPGGSGSPSPSRRRSSTAAAAAALQRTPDIERELDLERSNTAEHMRDLREQAQYVSTYYPPSAPAARKSFAFCLKATL